MKLGILGTGKIVRELLQVYEGLEIEKTYLLCTQRSLPQAEQLCREYGLEGVYTDYDALLDADIDTVYVALPNHLHFAYTQMALERGKDVILEKPATSNLRELEALFALADRNGCCLMEAMTVHHLPGVTALGKALASIGTIREARLYFCQYSSRYDDFKAGKIHPVFDPQKSGGALYDLNLYNLHAALCLFGMPQGVRYEAKVERGIDVWGELTLDYGSFSAVCTGAKDRGGEEASVICGTKGALRVREPFSRLTGYYLNEEWIGTGEEHRMHTEFVRILQILKNRDQQELTRCRALSLTAAKLMEQARHQAGIRFGCDE